MNRTSIAIVAAACAVAAGLAAPAARAQAKDWREIKFKPAAAFEIPKPTVFTMKNGMTVFLMEDRELPLINVRAMIRTGSAWEPADKVGLASIMGSVQRTGGAGSMTGDQIDDFLAMRAASVETSVGTESGSASMNCLKQDFDDVFKVFIDVLRNPAFAQDKLDLAKVQARSGIARRNDNLGGVAGRELGKLVYGADSPYARTTEYATIDAITRDDLVAFHGKTYHPNNVLLGVSGDFDAKEMRKKLEGALGSWPKGPASATTGVAYRKEPNPGVFFIEKSDVAQANISMAHLGIDYKNPDFFAAQVMNEVLSGSFASRMFSNIRSKKGLAYGVSGGLGAAFTHPGLFRAGLQTKSSTMTEAVAALKEEIRGIIDNPPSDEEMAKSKDSILNSFVFNYSSKDQILAQQMTYAFYGLPADFLDQYRSRIEKVSKEDVAKVAKQYVHPDKLTILVVGKSAEFDKPVDTLGKVTTIDITIPKPGAAAAPAAAAPAGDPQAGRRVVGRAAVAMGGKGYASVKAIRQAAKVTLTMQGQAIPLSKAETIVFPDRMRQLVTTPMGEQVLVVDGKSAFAAAMGQVRDMPEMAEEAAKEFGRDLRFIVRYADDPSLVASATGKEDVDGQACDVVDVTFRGTTSRLWVDASGRVIQQSFDGENPLTKVPGKIVVRYSDYKHLVSREVPHRQIVSVDGTEVVNSTLEEFEVDPTVDESIFKKPGA